MCFMQQLQSPLTPSTKTQKETEEVSKHTNALTRSNWNNKSKVEEMFMKLLWAYLCTSKHVLWNWIMLYMRLSSKGKIQINSFTGNELLCLRKPHHCRREKSPFKYIYVGCIPADRNCLNDFSLKTGNLGKLKWFVFLKRHEKTSSLTVFAKNTESLVAAGV